VDNLRRLRIALRYLRAGRTYLFWNVLRDRRSADATEPARPRRDPAPPAVRVVSAPRPGSAEPPPPPERLPSDDLYIRMSLRVARAALDSIPSPPAKRRERDELPADRLEAVAVGIDD
jgi:hypothetical protein